MEDALRPLQDSSDQVHHHLAQLQQKKDDLKNRLGCNNLRFIGLPKGAEEANPATFLKDLLITTYGREAYLQSFMVERAHHMVAKPPPQGVLPPAFIAKLLNYKDHDTICCLSPEKGNIPYYNIFPDFSVKVQQQHNFTEIKRHLQKKPS